MEDRDAVGSAADEAAALFAAAEGWARTRLGHLSSDDIANGSASCALCPLCQGIAAARQVRPETVEHLLAAASSVVAALRAAVAPAPEPPDQTG